jgi:ubiquinone/menaquinone biosynthesis C-methylase UbiE
LNAGSVSQPALLEALGRSLAANGSGLGITEIEFLRGVFGHGLERYHRRLAAIGLLTGGTLLDAGCGFGQWSLAASGDFERTVGIDIAPTRVAVCRSLANEVGVTQCEFVEGSLETLPFPDASFDAGVSYSAIYYTKYRRSIAELGRVLRPGALLYLNTNDVGRYLVDVVRNRYRNADFNSRRYGLAAIGRTAAERLAGLRRSGGAIAMSYATTTDLLVRAGFDIVAFGPEGSLGKGDESWQPGRFAGFTASYDVLARRK